ncbi:hypothetical protein Bca4012_010109 [Brassica carinata]
MSIVEELPKAKRKGPAFNKKWAKRYAFMSLPGSTNQWNIIAGTHPAPSEGECTVLRARQLPLDRRQVNILVGETVLQRSMSGSAADDSFAGAKRGSTTRIVSGNDVVVTGSRCATVVKTDSASLSEGRKTRGGGVMTRASHQSAD